MSARNVVPSIRMTVSGRFGNATRPKRRPEQGRRRHHSSCPVVAARRAQRVTDQHGGAVAEAAGEKEVETSAIRRSDARNALAAPRHVAVLELPVEDDVAMPARRRRFAEAATPAAVHRPAVKGEECSRC